MHEASEGFEIFVAIVDAGSISAASRQLEVPRETLSRQLGRLEERLGVRLVHRGPRRLVLTEAGHTLYERARRLVVAAREAQEAVRHLDDTPRGVLRVSAPPGAAAVFLGELVLGYMERWPEVTVELVVTSRFVDLVAEGIDVVIRAGGGLEPNWIARRLWSGQLVAVASGAYLERHGRPQTVEALAAHNCVLGMAGTERAKHSWPTCDGGQVEVSGRFSCNDLNAHLLAALRGHGVALLPDRGVQQAIEEGRLEQILPGVLGGEVGMWLVYLERTFMPPKVRAFVDMALVYFQERFEAAHLEESIRLEF